DKKINISGKILDNGNEAEHIEAQHINDIVIPEIPTEPVTQPKDINYWRSFKELYSNPDFIRAKKLEFQPGELERPDVDKMSVFSRRKFLALMTASASVA